MKKINGYCFSWEFANPFKIKRFRKIYKLFFNQKSEKSSLDKKINAHKINMIPIFDDKNMTVKIFENDKNYSVE